MKQGDQIPPSVGGGLNTKHDVYVLAFCASRRESFSSDLTTACVTFPSFFTVIPLGGMHLFSRTENIPNF